MMNPLPLWLLPLAHTFDAAAKRTAHSNNAVIIRFFIFFLHENLNKITIFVLAGKTRV